jgi:CMP-N,N'-diacetyllegionaminic acid synthase
MFCGIHQQDRRIEYATPTPQAEETGADSEGVETTEGGDMKLEIQEWAEKPNHKKPKIIGICPARGGSTRLPDKNMRMFAGRPLVAWTTVQAMNSLALDEFWVTTDEDRIEECAGRLGAKVFRREKENDDAPGWVPIIQLLEKVAEPDDIVVVLYSTSPLRKPSDIDDAVRKYLFSPDHANKYLMSVVRIHEDFRWKVLNDDNCIPLPSSENENCRLDGAIGVCTRAMYEELIRTEGDVYYIPYFVEPWQAQDINTGDELRFAELLFYDNILSDGLNPYEVYRKGGLKL